MSKAYWQAKIWGLLHDPALKALHNNYSGRGGNSFWQELPVMQDWKENDWNPETSSKTILKHIHLADYIASASDRGAIGSVSSSINYNDQGLEVAHLLSGEKLRLKLREEEHQRLKGDRKAYLQQQEEYLRQAIPPIPIDDYKQWFWWLWRCLPEATCQAFSDPSLLLMPAETRLPDSSIWSHASLTAALAGALAGYNLTVEQIEKTWSGEKSLPYLASFTFSPVQELIKASRKMRDFWAGSWLLHYLSAKVSWKLAQQYGPDCLLYPNLYQQPLIDHWLLKAYPQFSQWIEQPRDRGLLTAGFPNVLVVILPQGKVAAAMQTAKSTLLEAWREIGDEVLEELQEERHWLPTLKKEDNTWRGWLDSQWQTYWTAMPIGTNPKTLKSPGIPTVEGKLQEWIHTQNQAYHAELFNPQEQDFLLKAVQHRFDTQKRYFSINVGSWWADIFDANRLALTSVKNARNWVIPTAFGTRSTISGLGPVVHPGDDWITEGESQKVWQQEAGLFDGREQLNATETLKRGLEKALPKLLEFEEAEAIDKIAASYPDLTAGVAGYLKVNQDNPDVRNHFQQACQAITKEHNWARNVLHSMKSKWGIPWIDENPITRPIHSRLLNPGWLIEDAETPELKIFWDELKASKTPEKANQINQEIREIKQSYRQEIQTIIDRYYPSNNPANWYVLAAGDGDGMSQWLKGEKLKKYQDYVPSGLESSISNDQIRASFVKFLDSQKRMGASTHNALSRALLDFSNQLVPYLTEERYAGRLIYGGGDDVLAYTNLWEWDRWLWDIRQCFRGQDDPLNEFSGGSNKGDYWQWREERGKAPEGLSTRPLFTMGHRATISFGIAIAHHSVPLAITLENLWEAEAEAKEHFYHKDGNVVAKDAVQVRVLYSNGNILKATSKFETFQAWQQLLEIMPTGESSIFEQAGNLVNQHPIPVKAAIAPWTAAFVSRREGLEGEKATRFQQCLTEFLEELWLTTPEEDLTESISNWLKIAAFVQRNRDIKLGGQA
ncbi:MAG: type III-B CRISPR-associated protein Cas10/Cmr2 [Halothece sp.]